MKNKLIVIAGPTAIGKTTKAIQLAQWLDSEIISADSRQFYKELKIGVATPSIKELEAVKHHFVGHLSIAEYYNVSRYEQDVLRLLETYFKEHQYGILVGGSGLYIDAVCKGIDELPDPDNYLRERLKDTYNKKGLEHLKNQLQELDPEYYKIVDLNNPNRILRALEVCIATGKTYTSLRQNEAKPREFEIIKIGLDRPREELFNIIEQRVDRMIEMGLVDEVQSLQHYKNLNALNTVGYKEIFNYLDGIWTLDLTIEKIKTHTRRYAKRQLTWFKKDQDITWFHPDEMDKIIKHINLESSK
ncbi:MAG: tRNA (adenosine(37)-N6)-dimethylallyltransferase MiaA [Bacteroidales bacterium]|nr:tRNA (adenosine(37)-N6)-dimethylallyltransferase MiaA [Bacteroidales bacterium]